MKAEVPDFLVMTTDSHKQSTSNDPYGRSRMNREIWENDLSLSRAMFGESPTPKNTPEMKSVLSLLGKSINTVKTEKSILREKLDINFDGESDDE